MERKSVFIGGKQIGVECLRYLISLGAQPKLVIGNLDDNGSDFSWHESLIKVAEENNIPVLKQTKLKDAVEAVKEIGPEIIFCIGGTQIIPDDIIKIPLVGCLNLHPALLPKYRGRFSTMYAIFNGEDKTGVTAHWLDSGMDHGPIIAQKQFPIQNDDTAKDVYHKFTQHGIILFKQIVGMWLRREKIKSTEQNHKEASTMPFKLPNDGEIDWNWEAKKIRNFIRALTFEPFPPASFMLGKKKMVIVDEQYFNGFKDEKN